MNTQSLNEQIHQQQLTFEQKIKDNIFPTLNQIVFETNEPRNTFPLERLDYLYWYYEKEIKNNNKQLRKLIFDNNNTKKSFENASKGNDNEDNEEFTQETMANLFSGKNAEDILFNSTILQQKNNIDFIINLFNFLKDENDNENNKGISFTKLKTYLSNTMNNIFPDKTINYDSLIQDIKKYCNIQSDTITLEQFIEIMTTYSSYDKINI